MAAKNPIFVGSVETNTTNMSATKRREGSHTLNLNMRFVCMTNNEINALIVMDAACVIMAHKEQNAQNALQANYRKIARDANMEVLERIAKLASKSTWHT
jgi:hypothetical protein